MTSRTTAGLGDDVATSCRVLAAAGHDDLIWGHLRAGPRRPGARLASAE